MLQASSHQLAVAVWGIVWASVPRPPWATGVRSTGTAGQEGPAMAEAGAAGKRKMTPRARRTCPGGVYPRGRASWTSSAVNSWADTHPRTTTTTNISSRLVRLWAHGKIFPSLPLAEKYPAETTRCPRAQTRRNIVTRYLIFFEPFFPWKSAFRRIIRDSMARIGQFGRERARGIYEC